MLKTAAISFTIIHIVMLVIFMKYKSDIFCKIKKLRSHFAKKGVYTTQASRTAQSARTSKAGDPLMHNSIARRLLSGKITGLPIFAAVMFTVFHLTFDTVGRSLSVLLATALDICTARLDHILLTAGTCRPLHDLLIYGICPGIGSVLSFVPLIAVLFCLLAILEDCGYFSYAAALFDSGMSRLGLSGQCIVPLIMGFGCAVPAVMSASSMLEGNKKLRTIFMIPFMSCSARLPVYSVLISAFFEDHRAIVVWFIYLTGITTAMICAGLAGKIADGRRPNNLSSSNCRCQRGSGYSAGHKTRTGGGHFTTPSLKPPRISYVLDVVLTKSLGFVKKAFSVILAASVVIWFLQSFDCGFHMVSDCRESMLVFLGRSVAPFFEPLGFGSWQAASAMIAGLSAKEAIISTFSVIASSSGMSSFSLLSSIFTPAGAISFMVFCLLYVPCIATLATVRKETGSWRCSIIMCFGHILLALSVCFVIYNIFSHL